MSKALPKYPPTPLSVTSLFLQCILQTSILIFVYKTTSLACITEEIPFFPFFHSLKGEQLQDYCHSGEQHEIDVHFVGDSKVSKRFNKLYRNFLRFLTVNRHSRASPHTHTPPIVRITYLVDKIYMCRSPKLGVAVYYEFLFSPIENKIPAE